jgi:transposase InsO family protein
MELRLEFPIQLLRLLSQNANPKGNANIERLIRTIKEELCWLYEWASIEEVTVEVEKFVEYFNASYLHSALGHKTPNAFENVWFKNK